MSESPQTALRSPAIAVPGDLGWHLATILRAYQSRFEEATDGMPEGIRGYQVLSTVVHRNPPNQQALGAHLAIDRTVLTYLLDNLVAAGVVERVPAPSDRRARKIEPTQKGREILAHYEQRVADAEAALLDGLPTHTAHLFREQTADLAGEVHRAEPGADPCKAINNLS